MSWVSTPRRVDAMGDPGLFSFLGKVVGAGLNVATGGVSGTVLNAVKGLVSKRPAPAGPMYTTGLLGSGTALALRGATPTLVPQPVALPGGAVIRADSVKVQRTTVGPGGSLFSSTSATAYGPTAGALPGQPTGRCMLPSQDGRSVRIKATHANKHGYYVHPRGSPESATYVAPGTRCVVNRRRNPLNPRALSRAMSRIHGAQKAIRHLVRFERVCRGGKLHMAHPAGGRKKACGCK